MWAEEGAGGRGGAALCQCSHGAHLLLSSLEVSSSMLVYYVDERDFDQTITHVLSKGTGRGQMG